MKNLSLHDFSTIIQTTILIVQAVTNSFFVHSFKHCHRNVSYLGSNDDFATFQGWLIISDVSTGKKNHKEPNQESLKKLSKKSMQTLAAWFVTSFNWYQTSFCYISSQFAQEKFWTITAQSLLQTLRVNRLNSVSNLRITLSPYRRDCWQGSLGIVSLHWRICCIYLLTRPL